MVSGAIAARKGWSLRAAAAAWALALLAPVVATAQDPQSLRDLFGSPFSRDDRAAALPMVARYQDDLGQRFVLDRSGGLPLMRFDDSPEIWVLRATPGPRGDVIYRNDLGDPVLRSMRVGGLTLFTSERPMGVAAAPQGVAPALREVAISTPAQLLQAMIQASTRASRAAQKLIPFEAPDYMPGTEAVFADAAVLTAEAFVQVGTAGRNGRGMVARFVRVRFSPGKAPSAAVAGREVRIVVSPKDGLAGRPSSKRIAMVLASR